MEPSVAPWDRAAPQIVLEEAGAKLFALDGTNSIYQGNCAACTEAELKRYLGLEANS